MFIAGAVCIAINWRGLGPLWFAGVALVVTGMLMLQLATRAQRPPRDEREPVTLAAPVQGTWTARNGPATKVPTHLHF